MKNFKKINLFLIITIFFIISCGRKGDPVLQRKIPSSVKDITVIQKDRKIEIAWSYPRVEQERIKGFRILKADKEKDFFKEVAFLDKNVLRFIDEDTKEKETYHYKIIVVDQKDRVSEESVITVSPVKPLKAPIDITYSLKDNSLQIRWSPSDSAKYYVYKSYEKGKFESLLNSTPIAETFYRDRIEKDKTVYYSIKAVKEEVFRVESPFSEELEIDPATFIPSKPNKPTYVISKKGIYLLWNENPETWINGYRIYRKNEEESEFKAIGESLLPTFLDKEVISSKRIYYITALGPKKESPSSEPVEVIPLVER